MHVPVSYKVRVPSNEPTPVTHVNVDVSCEVHKYLSVVHLTVSRPDKTYIRLEFTREDWERLRIY